MHDLPVDDHGVHVPAAHAEDGVAGHVFADQRRRRVVVQDHEVGLVPLLDPAEALAEVPMKNLVAGLEKAHESAGAERAAGVLGGGNTRTSLPAACRTRCRPCPGRHSSRGGAPRCSRRRCSCSNGCCAPGSRRARSGCPVVLREVQPVADDRRAPRAGRNRPAASGRPCRRGGANESRRMRPRRRGCESRGPLRAQRRQAPPGPRRRA